ncbi:MAG: hypothetical protein P1V51_23490 [Deltaproteobacteria bacterium]|nr:hypothetical protein [Deltaproteobacteria bacterium]
MLAAALLFGALRLAAAGEGGYALLRPTRFGLSAGVDAHGRVRGQASAFDAPETVLIVDLPRRGVTTLYARAPFLFPLACALLVLSALLREAWRALRRRRALPAVA